MNIIKKFCFLAVMCLVFAACEEKKFGDGVKLKDIELSGSSLRVNLGETDRMYAFPIPYDCTDYEFKWVSSDPGIVTVDAYGRVTARDIGTVTVTVSQGSISKQFSVETYEVTLREKVDSLKVKGFWQFLDANDLFKASVGTDLIPVGTGFEQIAGFNSRTKTIVIPCSQKVGDEWQYNHLIYNHNFGANGGSDKSVNEFTILIDCKFPGDGGPSNPPWVNGKYYSLYQTDLYNNADASFFWRPGADWGLRGRYTNSNHLYVRDTWYRFIISVKLGQSIRYFLNGTNYPAANNGELDNYNAWDVKSVLLFADDDGEDGQGFPLHVANLAIWDKALTDDQIKYIGPLVLL